MRVPRAHVNMLRYDINPDMTFINDSAILWYTAAAGEKGKSEEVSRGCLEDRSTENDPAVA